jgi:hypothetical protein
MDSCTSGGKEHLRISTEDGPSLHRRQLQGSEVIEVLKRAGLSSVNESCALASPVFLSREG